MRARRRQTWLSAWDRTTLKAIAETAIPKGLRFRGAGENAVEKLDDWMANVPYAVQGGFKAILLAIEQGARLRYRKSFSQLDTATRMEILLAWHEGSYFRRMALRTLLTPLKVAHFHDPEIFAQLRCRFGVPTAAVERPRFLDRVVSGTQLIGKDDLECDVVVIGTGAGGAVVAKELAERGVAVVMLEEGDFLTRADFTGHTVDMQRLLYRDFGATITVGNVPIPVPIGRAVGGTTVINSGTCYRTPARVFTKWQRDLGLREMTPEHLAPYFERVEATLGVATADEKVLGGVARVIARGCDALGYTHNPLRRNAPDCDGQGICCFGCPTDAKRSMNVSYIPLALRAGAQLFTATKAVRVRVGAGRAVGIEAKTRGGGRITVHAKAVVVSCGSLLTPIFLMNSGLFRGASQLGRNLSIHPAVAVGAIFEETIEGYNAIPQGYAIEEFHDEGLLFEGAFVPPDLGAGTLQFFGHTFTDTMEAYDRLAIFGFMLEDASRGRVRRGPSGHPLITYWMDDSDVARVKRGIEILSRVYFAAGAERILPLVHGFDEFRDLRDVERFRGARVRARDFDFSAYHPLGTARLSGDPERGVCNPHHETWAVPGLYVVDGAAVPTSVAVNPQMTIMALATRAAQHIAERVCK